MRLPEYSSTAGARGVSSSHLIFCWRRRCHSLPLVAIVLCVLVFLFTEALPCTRDKHLDSYASDHCSSNDENDYLVADGKNLPECGSLERLCPLSDAFCFPSTLPGIQDKFRSFFLGASGYFSDLVNADFIWNLGDQVYKLSDRKKVTCSTTKDGRIIDGLSSKNENINRKDEILGGVSLPPNAWVRGSNEMTNTTEEIESSLIYTSLSPYVEFNPPSLDWGTRRLYSPSCSLLTMNNMHNDSVLHVYEPLSTNPQFYIHDFQELVIPPGKAASISFVFLPRWLNSSSAQIVLQTSFGGFIIHAKGRAIESSYRIQPLVEFEAPQNGRLYKNLSLYNPFDELLYIEEVSMLVFDASHSSNVVCWKGDIQEQLEESSSFKEHDKHAHHMKMSEYGPTNLGIIPRGKWEVSPHDTRVVLEVSIMPHMEGNVSGVVCITLRKHSQDEIQTIMVPLEANISYKVGCDVSAGSVSVLLEPLMTLVGKGYMVSMRNHGSSILQLTQVKEITDTDKIFKVKYTEGLFLYPSTLTHIAFITEVLPVDSLDTTHEVACKNLNCRLQISTNESASRQIELSCCDIVSACSKHVDGSVVIASKDSSIGSRFEHKESASDISMPSANLPEDNLSKKSIFEAAIADELILRNWKYQGSMIEMSVLDDHELMFPLVEVGTPCSKWISVRNPSQKPVIMQLLLNSGSVINHCKSAFDVSEHHVISSRFARISSIENLSGFSMGKSAIIQALIHPSEKASFGPITFRPSNRCMWRSSALIRNNLTGVEWLPLQGIGGSRSLVVLENSKPVQRLEFNIDWSIPLNISSFHTDQVSATCAHLLSKELFLKNTGELFLEVLKMEVSGASCELDGFRIHTCEAFSLAPGESIKLCISFQSDFTVDVIYRDLELVLSSGIVVIPMKANISIYTMKICRKSFVWSLVKTIPLVIFFGFSLTSLVFFFLPPTFPLTSEDDYTTNSKSTIATITKVGKSRIHRNQRNARMDYAKPKSNAFRYSETRSNNKINAQNVECKHDFDYQEKAPKSEEQGGYNISETTYISDLTVKIAQESGKRRRRRSSGTIGLANKVEVSSSQSGNSTPTSPLTPNSLTTKQVWPLSERKWDKVKASVNSTTASGSSFDANIETLTRRESIVANEWPTTINKPTLKPVLFPSATFPPSGRHAPGYDSPQKFLINSSPIAPHARAPGSRLGKDNVVKREKETFRGKEFTYDIWGNHLADHIMGRSKKLLPKPFSDASEGDSLSFFARGPQSLMKMSSAARSTTSSGPDSFSYGVKYDNQMV